MEPSTLGRQLGGEGGRQHVKSSVTTSVANITHEIKYNISAPRIQNEMTSKIYLFLHNFAPLFGTSRVVQKTLQGYTSLHNVPHTVPHNFKCKFVQKTASAGQRGTQCPAHCPARFRRQFRKTIASAGRRGTVAGQLSRALSRAI